MKLVMPPIRAYQDQMTLRWAPGRMPRSIEAEVRTLNRVDQLSFFWAMELAEATVARNQL